MATVLEGEATAASDHCAVDFRRIFETTPAPHLVLAPDLTVVAANDAFMRTALLERAAVIGRHVFDIFRENPNDAAATGPSNLRASLNRVLETHASDTMPIQKYDIPRPGAPGSFEERYWSVVNRPVLSDDGTLIYIIHRAEDVTDLVQKKQERAQDSLSTASLRERTEQLETEMFLRAQELHALNEQLRQSEDRLRVAVEGADLAIWTWEPATDRILYQRNVHRLYGLSKPATSCNELREMMPAEDRAAAEAACAHSLETGADYDVEYRVIWPDGTLHWLAAKGRIQREGDSVLMAGINLDITERKATEAALFEAREDFRLIIDGALDHAILRLDTSGNVQSWNPGAARIFGYAESEIIGGPLSTFFTTEDRESKRPAYELAHASAHEQLSEDRWHVRKDGSRFWASGTISALRDRMGALRGFVKILSDGTARKLAEEQTAYLAHHDALTGLPNRAYFSIKLHEMLAQAKREAHPAAVMLLDLDRFKQVNDTQGHDTGDALLKEVGARLLASVRETDCVARLGGDEFIVLQANASNAEGSAILARKIIEIVSQPMQIGSETIQTGTSIGIALFPADGEDGAELLKNADLAMYRAKSLGRGKYQFYSEDLRDELHNRKSQEALLRETFEKQELELYYQPQIDLESWQLTGVEALLRWTNPAWRALRVSDVLALAEETGLIVPIGEWVLNAACAQKKAWSDAGLPPFRVAVNFSARQLDQLHVTEMIQRALDSARTHAPSLELEINERLLSHAGVDASGVLMELKRIGVRLSIDEFGISVGGVNYLRRFPVDALKIDRSLVRHLPHSRSDMAIVSSLVALARKLDLQIVAAGIETAEHLAAVRSLGCTAAQGYLFSAPVPAQELETLLRQGNWSRMNPD